MKKIKKGIVINKFEFIVKVKSQDAFMYNELVQFPNGQKGLVIKSDTSEAQVIIFKDDNIKKAIVVGDEVIMLDQEISINTSLSLLGAIISGDGQMIRRFDNLNVKYQVDKLSQERNIFEEAKPIYSRDFINKYLETGTTIIDWAIPIGKGQRELIIGDRKTGKTSIALNMILAQKNNDTKCIYVSIGQKQVALSQIINKIKDNNMANQTTIVTAGSNSTPTLRYLAPYIGMTIAEHFQQHGNDVLIVFDDLSKHAISYREISMLIENPPARNAYPGDIFYIHSSLLERAGAFNKKYGGGSITAIPIIQTENGDIASFIPTNVISITDGQIFTSKEMFNSQQRPAINVPYSISRIGSSTQNNVMKKYALKIKYIISRYIESVKMRDNYGFVSETNKKIIEEGDTLFPIINQDENDISGYDLNIILLILFKKGYLSFIKYIDNSIINKIKNSIWNYLIKSLAGQKLSQMLKVTSKEIDKKLLSIFLELEILPIIKFHLLTANDKLENNKKFQSLFGNIRNDLKLLNAYREKQKNQKEKIINNKEHIILQERGNE